MEKNYEKCITVSVNLGNKSNDIEELNSLVEAVSGKVFFTIEQNRKNIDPKYYVGKGKIDEVSNLVEMEDIDSVIFNDELSNTQIRNIEEKVNCKIIDRTNLILDIFALRAKTGESKIQVELAQLEYRYSKLKGKGIDMSRLGAGIGTRGPGEKKLETDRRHIMNRIEELKKSLEKVKKVRKEKRKRRMKNQIPTIAVVGYTNAGKSTLINALTKGYGVNQKEVFEKDMLFATLTTENRKLIFPHNLDFIITDTVGFINNLPTFLVESFKSTLEEIAYSDIILNVIDINSENIEEQKKVTEDILKELKVEGIPLINIYNKIDSSNEKYRDKDQELFISAKKRTNIEAVPKRISEIIYGKEVEINVSVKYTEPKKINYIEKKYNIINKEMQEESINFTIKTREKLLRNLHNGEYNVEGIQDYT
ncbi:MAG: GTPase HflX [Bacillota bacterium]|nr:GTPase HflX [Bacillota bacterium]